MGYFCQFKQIPIWPYACVVSGHSLTQRTEQTVSATMGTAGAFYSVPLNYQFNRRPLPFGYLRQPPFLLPVTWSLNTFSRQQVSSTFLILELYFPV